MIGGASMQSCSEYKIISGKPNIKLFKLTENKQHIEKIIIYLDKDVKNKYEITFQQPALKDSLIYQLKTTSELKLEINKQEYKKIKKEENELVIPAKIKQ